MNDIVRLMIQGGRGTDKRQVFVDESLQSGLTLVAVSIPSDQLVETRRCVRQLLLPQQTHLHFTRESDGRRRMIMKSLTELSVAVVIYEFSGRSPMRVARARCLRALLGDLAEGSCERLVIENDESLRDSDIRVLYRAVRDVNLHESLTYAHVVKRAEPLLWVADAFAWCWTHKLWREVLKPVDLEMRRVGDEA
ncbi:MAG: hypothetical protein U0Q19_07530 [Kineosporiaceae bacterium]